MPLLVELGVLLVGVLDDVLDADLVLAELVTQAEDLLDRDRGAQHHLQHAPVAVFDALGDLDLAFAREQRDRTHLAQVHPHRIAGGGIAVGVFLLLGLPLRREIRVGFVRFVGFVRVRVADLDLRRRIDDLDAFVRERRQPVVHALGGHDVLRHVLVDLLVGQEALGLADRDQRALLALAFLRGGRALCCCSSCRFRRYPP